MLDLAELALEWLGGDSVPSPPPPLPPPQSVIDDYGNATEKSATVTVPHDQRSRGNNSKI